MVAQTDRRVLWHPRHEHKFAVGGGANITLYEWTPDSPVIRHISAQDDLQHMKVRYSKLLLPSCALI